jgi:hypothetical protein
MLIAGFAEPKPGGEAVEQRTEDLVALSVSPGHFALRKVVGIAVH